MTVQSCDILDVVEQIKNTHNIGDLLLKCYGYHRENKIECKSCDLVSYCKEAGDLKVTSKPAYDDGRTNQEHKPIVRDEERRLSSNDLTQALMEVTKLLQKNPTRHKVMISWLHDFDGSPAKGRDGLVVGIAGKCNINPRTAMRHVQALSACPILSTIFKYENCRIGDRTVDKGAPIVFSEEIKQGLLF